MGHPTSSSAVDQELTSLPLADELGELEEALRYSLLGGGKRIRPVLCLATGEALARTPAEVLPAACALELSTPSASSTTTFPRWTTTTSPRRPTSTCSARRRHPRGGRAPHRGLRPARLCEPGAGPGIAAATLGMIGGQYVDVTTDGDLDADGLVHLHELKTGRLLRASVTCAVAVAGLPPDERKPWAASGPARPALPDRRRHPGRHRHGLRARQDSREGRGRRQGHVCLAARAPSARGSWQTRRARG